MRWRNICWLLMLGALLGYAQPTQAAGEQCFAETGYCVSGRFLQYWQQNGGLAVFGYPTGPVQNEQNRETGQTFLTQWFERNRFELHPENRAPYDVLLGRLGDDLLRQQGIDWQQQPRDSVAQAGCLWFAQTGHNVCNQSSTLGFATYWQNHGLGDPALNRYGRSLALFGLPLTDARVEINAADGQPYLTQWFERARFEWHPDKPDQFKVLLGLLGHEAHVATTDLAGTISFVQSADIFKGGNVYHMNANGGQLATVTTQASLLLDTAELAWSPNGSRVAYTSGNTLYVTTADGSNTTAVAQVGFTSPDVAHFAPTWSPDSLWLAYVYAGDIYATRLDGAPPVQITRETYVDNNFPLSWSPLGYIAYTTSGHIGRINSDGSEQMDLGAGTSPLWSPDGTTLAFSNEGGIWLTSYDGRNRRMVITSQTDAASVPIFFTPAAWVPTGGSLLAIGRNIYNSYGRDIYQIDVASYHLTRLTTHPDLDDYPSWSPDAQHIVFASKRNGRYELFVMRADGTGQTRIATPMEASMPHWSR